MTSLGQKKVCICRHFGWHWNYMRLFWKTVSQHGAKPFHPSLSRWNHLLCFCITSKKSTTCSTLSLLLSWCMVLGHLVVFSSATTWAVTRHGIFPGKNTGVDCHFLLQGIFPAQGTNLCLLCLLLCQTDSLPLAPPGNLYHTRNVSQYFVISVVECNF